jgi:hypothetical protein
MKKNILIFLSLLILSNIRAQKIIPYDTLKADFSYFINLLENSHPDPYSAYGGRVLFHKKAWDIEQDLPREGCTAEAFADTIKNFLAILSDGHTNINTPVSNKEEKLLLPLRLHSASDGLFINSLPEEYKPFWGSRLDSIEKIPINKILEKVATLSASENIYGRQFNLRSQIWNFNYVKRLFPQIRKRITLQITTPDNLSKELTLPFLSQEDYNKIKIATNLSPDSLHLPSDNYMFYQFVDKDNKTMIFHLESVMAREAFIMMKNKGMKESDIESELYWLYRRYLNKKMPANINDAIDSILSIANSFHAMLLEMKENKATTLIIDLRDNGGGWTPIILPTLYMLFGNKYLDMDMGITDFTRLSELYMKKFNTTLEEYNKSHSTSYKIGDYDFYEHEHKTQSIEDCRTAQMKELKSYCDSALIENLNGEPIYSPKHIFVITNDGTYSAAFHYAFYLWKLGVTTVGIPPGQAPNTFMEVTPFELPLTKLSGSISNNMQSYLPYNDKRAKIFYPEYTLSYADYKKYNFDKYAEILYVIDLLKTLK